jgi:hypothetical protein
MTITAYGIGTTTSTSTLASLGVVDPKSPMQYYVEYRRMADGTQVGRGLPIIVWQWGYLSRAQRDALRAFCSDVTAWVYIDTRENNSADAFAQYKSLVTWPLEESRETGRRVPFILEFSLCEKQ